jgi:dipeptidyl aminopeptidase/acylaminoacyl peptidase
MAAALPVESFAALPHVQSVKLSPDGSKLAYLYNHNGTLVLSVINIKENTKKPILQTDNLNQILSWYEWANNDVLLLGVSYTSKQRTIKYTSTRLLKYDLSPKKQKLVQFMNRRSDREKNVPQFQDNVISFLPDDNEHILVAADFDTVNRPSVYKLNIYSKKRKRIKRGKSNITDWIADRQGNIKIGYGFDETRIFYKFYGEERAQNSMLYEYDVFSKDKVNIIGFDKDPNYIYITALHNDKEALFKVNLSDKNLARELIFSDPDYDFDGNLLYSHSTGEVIGFSHSNLPNGRQYWDSEQDKLQRSLAAALPDDFVSVIDLSENGNSYIVYKHSETDPGSYFFGNRAEKNINLFAQRYPDITEDVIAKKDIISYEARDGIKIEGYLTLPTNQASTNLPTVILPHGGPMARDYGNFDYWSQMLANQGYAVLQPNFRGSSGYGYAFEMSALQNWGGEMQNDLQDAAHWMIEQGYTDKNRVCMVGASYGGYAALMSVVKHPETFKCAASFAPVTDLEAVVAKARYFTNKEIVRAQFGTDSDQLEAQSPLNYASKVKRPILLIHGTDDKVVPVSHSREMYDELKDHNKDVKYIELEDGNHNLSYQAHRMTTLSAISDFLKKHL